jgi:hypothetical protein
VRSAAETVGRASVQRVQRAGCVHVSDGCSTRKAISAVQISAMPAGTIGPPMIPLLPISLRSTVTRAQALFDDLGADVAEHNIELGHGAAAAPGIGRVDPRHRLAVQLTATDGPIQQVLEATW